MNLFSERNGYVQPSDILIKRKITSEIQNAICSCYDRLEYVFRRIERDDNAYRELEKFLWTHFLNQREGMFYENGGYRVVATRYIEDEKNEWFKKLDLVELTIKFLYARNGKINPSQKVANAFVQMLNYEFERLHFAYRVVNKEIVEINSDVEITTIENALRHGDRNVKFHLDNSLQLYGQKPTGDYRNSIKESISAVEAYCREKTGKNTLGEALKELERVGIVLPKLLKNAFEKLYNYTNQPETGIRHALMDNDGDYVPSSEEALFMLVTCSAFVNYLRAKEAKRAKK